MANDLLYPTLADVLSIHEDIIAEDADAEPGVRSPEAVEAALTYISVGYFDYEDEPIREILNQFATDADAVEMSEIVAYCREHAQPAED